MPSLRLRPERNSVCARSLLPLQMDGTVLPVLSLMQAPNDAPE